MSNSHPARRSTGRLSRAERDAARVAGSIDASTELAIRRVRAAEEVECAKIEAIGAATAVGLVEVSTISALEVALFQRSPYAGPRLQLIADAGSTGIAGVITKLDRRLR